jgi:hypothetical protein
MITTITIVLTITTMVPGVQLAVQGHTIAARYNKPEAYEW